MPMAGVKSLIRFRVAFVAMATGAFLILVPIGVELILPLIENHTLVHIQPQETPLAIAAEERELLWEIEHCGNILAKDGFSVLAQALAAANRDKLLELLAADFRGSDMVRPKEVRHNDAMLQVIRRQDTGNPSAPLTRDE